MRVRIKRVLCLVLKWGFWAYVTLVALIGTGVLLYPVILVLYNGWFAPAPMPIHLPNGFIYERDTERRYGLPRAIYDKEWHEKDRKSVVMGDVKNVMWHENSVYGFRRGLAKEPYYYICTYGEDCSDTQHLTEVEFKRLLKEQKLPAYDAHIAKTYDALLWRQSREGAE